MQTIRDTIFKKPSVLTAQNNGISRVTLYQSDWAYCSEALPVTQEVWENWIKLWNKKPAETTRCKFIYFAIGEIFPIVGGVISVMRGQLIQGILFFVVGTLMFLFAIHFCYQSSNELTYKTWREEIDAYKTKYFLGALHVEHEKFQSMWGDRQLGAKDQTRSTFVFNLDVYNRRVDAKRFCLSLEFDDETES